MHADQAEFQDFLSLSSVVTGFTAFQLQGTGQAESYFSTLIDILGEATVAALLQVFRRVQRETGEDAAALDRLLRAAIFSDEKLGPIARNLIKLWYVGTWYPLPAAWREAFGELEKDTTFVVSPAAYTEGLLWPAIGANPAGAKGPGYGTWSAPPRIPEV
ncbi:MAG: hypothetical protein P9F19_08560 [Candidatus Contendobacter sp.]|nr:hypothetical protein [Candidatus Contendobacter sp.]MDG4557424.1 hypothetical protein [Candidatus Contendobacter sp.]